MATYSILRVSEDSVRVKVSDLSTSYNYQVEFFIRLSDDTSDVTYKSKFASNYNTSLTKTISGLESDTDYTMNVGIDDGTGNKWIGAKSFTTEKAIAKPNTFSWTYEKTQGEAFKLTASEWNEFTARINEMREYLDLSSYSFTDAVKGENFTATMYNQARIAIQGMGNDVGYYIPTVSKGDNITAYMMNILVSELNSAILNL